MKTVLITGISKGIGEALAKKFLSEGWKVLGTIYKGITSIKNDNLLTFSLDLSSPESVERCANEIGGTGEKIDILINNAGALFDEDETTVVVEKLRKTLEVNLTGTIDFTERMIPIMRGGGHIVNISSTAGSLERAGFGSASHFPMHYPSYKISKAALNMYTRTLAARLFEKITVSSVHPGWVKTDMGGEEADITPDEAAKHIFAIAVAPKETGGFWFKGERLPW